MDTGTSNEKGREQASGARGQVVERAACPDAEISDIDGFRVDLPDSWGLVRPSNTTPSIVLRFEGDDADALDAIKERFRHLLLSIDPSLNLPF